MHSSPDFSIFESRATLLCALLSVEPLMGPSLGARQVVDALPHDAHFMGIMLAELSALSTCHPEQNPALAGQSIYGEKEIVDKQICRLIGEQSGLSAGMQQIRPQTWKAWL